MTTEELWEELILAARQAREAAPSQMDWWSGRRTAFIYIYARMTGISIDAATNRLIEALRLEENRA